MNTLNLIKKQINKAAALHDSQILHTAYRGVEYDVNCATHEDRHGTFCYRGRIYKKWLMREGYKPSLFLYFHYELTNVSELTQTCLDSIELEGNRLCTDSFFIIVQ